MTTIITLEALEAKLETLIEKLGVTSNNNNVDIADLLRKLQIDCR